jgi:hypothetical protein
MLKTLVDVAVVLDYVGVAFVKGAIVLAVHKFLVSAVGTRALRK